MALSPWEHTLDEKKMEGLGIRGHIKERTHHWIFSGKPAIEGKKNDILKRQTV